MIKDIIRIFNDQQEKTQKENHRQNNITQNKRQKDRTPQNKTIGHHM